MLSEFGFNAYLWHINNTTMFNQYVGDGANVFIAIIAVLIGFAAASGYIDFKKVKKAEEKKD